MVEVNAAVSSLSVTMWTPQSTLHQHSLSLNWVVLLSVVLHVHTESTQQPAAFMVTMGRSRVPLVCGWSGDLHCWPLSLFMSLSPPLLRLSNSTSIQQDWFTEWVSSLCPSGRFSQSCLKEERKNSICLVKEKEKNQHGAFPLYPPSSFQLLLEFTLKLSTASSRRRKHWKYSRYSKHFHTVQPDVLVFLVENSVICLRY